MPSEQQQGIALAEAAKATGVQVYIWSSLPDVERLSGGKLVRSTETSVLPLSMHDDVAGRVCRSACLTSP